MTAVDLPVHVFFFHQQPGEDVRACACVRATRSGPGGAAALTQRVLLSLWNILAVLLVTYSVLQ